jgi:hypothetical protein
MKNQAGGLLQYIFSHAKHTIDAEQNYALQPVLRTHFPDQRIDDVVGFENYVICLIRGQRIETTRRGRRRSSS